MLLYSENLYTSLSVDETEPSLLADAITVPKSFALAYIVKQYPHIMFMATNSVTPTVVTFRRSNVCDFIMYA